jgi:glycosyltransferase involved in cell wall biosynthesis
MTDPVALVREAAAEVVRRRDAGAYPDELLQRLDVESRRPVAVPTAPEDVAYIASAHPLVSGAIFGPVVVGVKRVVRRLLAWYVRPVADDQTRFNLAMLAEVRRLQQRVDGLAGGDVASGGERVEDGDGAQGEKTAASPRKPAAAPLGIHQLVPVLSPRDAIGDAVLHFQQALRALGYQSEIFAGLIDRSLRHRAHPATVLADRVAAGDVVMYHLSIGSPLAGEFTRLPGRKAIYYHNISPAASVDGLQPVLARQLRRGRDDLDRLAPAADLSLAASTFSGAELEAAGAPLVRVLPLPLSVDRLAPRPARSTAGPALLFVGRFLPHKGQDLLVRTLAVLRATAIPDATLTLVGRVDVPEFADGLRALARRLGVADAVTLLTSPLTDRQLGDIYARSSAFLCASHHEGFCVPIVEAMAFSLPVLALAAAAVPETLGAAGLLVAGDDPLLWAELTHRLLSDQELRARLAVAARGRLAELDESNLATHLDAALAAAGWVDVRPG